MEGVRELGPFYRHGVTMDRSGGSDREVEKSAY